MKIASKMGISTIQSYQGSPDLRGRGHQPGGDRQVLYQHRQPGGRHRPGRDRRRMWIDHHQQAFDPLGLDIDSTLDCQRGCPQVPQRASAEDHLYNPQTIHLLQQAVRTGDYEHVQAVHRRWWTRAASAMHPAGPAGIQLSRDGGVPIDEVESVDVHCQALQDRRHELRLASPRRPTSAWPSP